MIIPFPTEWKVIKKNVPNHQPVIFLTSSSVSPAAFTGPARVMVPQMQTSWPSSPPNRGWNVVDQKWTPYGKHTKNYGKPPCY